MKVNRTSLISLALGLALLGGSTSAVLHAQSGQRACSRCNIVDEGLWGQSLINQTVYWYSRQTNRFYRAIVTAVFREGPFYVINWYDPATGQRGKNDATQYYSYRSMQEISGGAGQAPRLSQSEQQDKTGWLASCAMARSDNFLMALAGRNGCCNSTAARQYGPDPICR